MRDPGRDPQDTAITPRRPLLDPGWPASRLAQPSKAWPRELAPFLKAIFPGDSPERDESLGSRSFPSENRCREGNSHSDMPDVIPLTRHTCSGDTRLSVGRAVTTAVTTARPALAQGFQELMG